MIKIDNGQRTIEISANGEIRHWSYDVLLIKLLAEKLEGEHAMRTKVENKEVLLPPTDGFLAGFAVALQERGFEGCTIDAAFRVYNIVNAQFRAMYGKLAEQIAEEIAQKPPSLIARLLRKITGA
jgi:hypothetical protein